jgi:F0F1-type ATP synthase epsilon subunit
MKTFHVTIARVGEMVYEGEAHSLQLTGTEGVFTVYAGHEPFVSELVEGEAYVEDTEGTKHKIHIPHKGIAEVSFNQTTVLL